MGRNWIATAAHCIPLLNQRPARIDGVLEYRREIGSTDSPFVNGRRRDRAEYERRGPFFDTIFMFQRIDRPYDQLSRRQKMRLRGLSTSVIGCPSCSFVPQPSKALS